MPVLGIEETGAGAIGFVVGGLLAQDGRDVTLIDPWFEHIELFSLRTQFANHRRRSRP